MLLCHLSVQIMALACLIIHTLTLRTLIFPFKLSNVILRHSSFPHTSTSACLRFLRKTRYINSLLLLLLLLLTCIVCSPFIIGVMNQSSGSTTDLQLHHNFRWVLCANHMEPVHGFLARYLRRRLLDAQVRNDTELTEMFSVVEWLPQVWQIMNRLLETHGGCDVTVG